MKNCRKKIISLLTSAVVMTSFVGCGSSSTTNKASADSKDKKITINVVVKALNSDFWKSVQAGAEAAGKELGVTVKVIAPNSEDDVAGQTSMMEDSIINKVSCLVVAPTQPAAALATFDKADQAGIPVVLVDTDAKWDKKQSFVGTGNLAGGKAGGKFLAEKVGKGAEVVMIRGALGDPGSDDRVSGARESLEAAGVKVITVQPANGDRNKGMSVMENLLQAHPNIKGVYCTNDEMALGAIRALKQANRTDVAVTGFDGSPDALKAIKAGELTATVAQNSYNMGKISVETAVKVVKGEKVDKRIDTGTKLISKENVDQAQADLDKILKKQ